jgi:UDP-N-acetylglucosamine acyltransferase
MIHPTAIVSPDARLGAGVAIGPYAIVEAGVEIGDRCVLHGPCVLNTGTILGADVAVHPYATIGGFPQDLHFDPATRSGVRVGAGTVLREYVTLNRSTKAGGFTTIGEKCFLMVNTHVAHDCVLGDRVIAANNVMIAGHCTIGADVFFGGGCGLHQFSRIGEGAIISGLSRISFDIPPYLMVAERNEVSGLNLVGLRRRGVPRAAIAELKGLFTRVYAARNPKQEAAAALADGAASSTEGRRFLEFFGGGKRGIARPERDAATAGASSEDDS